jgi:hypothetical protein
MATLQPRPESLGDRNLTPGSSTFAGKRLPEIGDFARLPFDTIDVTQIDSMRQ